MVVKLLNEIQNTVFIHFLDFPILFRSMFGSFKKTKFQFCLGTVKGGGIFFQFCFLGGNHTLFTFK